MNIDERVKFGKKMEIIESYNFMKFKAIIFTIITFALLMLTLSLPL